MSIVKTRARSKVDGTPYTEVWMHRNKGRKIKAGERRGFSSRSGMAAMTDPELADIERPTVDKVAPLILKLMFVGKIVKGEQPVDVLTAQGHALYEFLMAAARIQGIERSEFRVPLSDAKNYLRIKHNDRLKALAEQLQDTTVQYVFHVDNERWEGRMPLLLVDYVTGSDGKTELVFSIQPRVKRVITEASQWAKLDINAYPHFKCKYTARLYPRLQLYSQYHEATRKPWVVSPKELASIVGFTYSGDFHFGNFEKGCLKPILRDIESWATLLSVTCQPVRGKGRGAPVEALSFECSPGDGMKPVGDGRMWHLNASDYKTLIAEVSGDPNFVPEDMPAPDLILKAAYRTKYHPFDLLRMWKGDLTSANSYPSSEIQFGLEGQRILDLFATHDVATAFEEWAQHVQVKIENRPDLTPTPKEYEVFNESGYSRSISHSENRAAPRQNEREGADAITASISAISAEELVLPHYVEELQGYCSIKHPAFQARLRLLMSAVGEAFEEVEDAMFLASIDRPTPEERRDLLLAMCRYVTTAPSAKQDEQILAVAKKFRQKHQKAG